jgi:hypothetical protein
MAKVDEFTELGMATELAKYVAGAVGGITALRGTFTMNGVTPVTVTNANLAAGDFVGFMLKTVGGTVGAYPSIKTRTNGTGFTVAGTASDTSVYDYAIYKG